MLIHSLLDIAHQADTADARLLVSLDGELGASVFKGASMKSALIVFMVFLGCLALGVGLLAQKPTPKDPLLPQATGSGGFVPRFPHPPLDTPYKIETGERVRRAPFAQDLPSSRRPMFNRILPPHPPRLPPENRFRTSIMT